jgi:hypothetical protein
MQTVWTDLSYLLRGTQRQRDAYRALQTLDLFAVLRDYSPVLVGTIPLDLDVEQSDLDIICQVHDRLSFQYRVTRAFGRRPHFQVRSTRKDNLPSVIVSFTAAGFPIEIFGQPRPVTEQTAYRHMVVESRLLAIGGEAARRKIRELKCTGLKTEPAFARHFHLRGDPYQRLLEFAGLGDEELASTIRRYNNS